MRRGSKADEMVIEGVKSPRQDQHVGKNIESFRNMLGISQDAMAKRLSVQKTAIERIERRVRVGRQVLLQVVAVFNSFQMMDEISIEDLTSFQQKQHSALVHEHNDAE
jgi:DNA-binding XRE family transcriptional regulator